MRNPAVILEKSNIWGIPVKLEKSSGPQYFGIPVNLENSNYGEFQ